MHCEEPELETEEVLSSFLTGCTNNCLYVDIGCNLGVFAAQASALGASVECYEPTPFLAACSNETARINSFSDTKVFNAAVVPTEVNLDEKLTFNTAFLPCGIGVKNMSAAKKEGGWAVPKIPLRRILHGKNVTLLKVDVDSIEGALLHTALEMMVNRTTHIDTIVVELGDGVNHGGGPRFGKFADLPRLQRLGYDIYRLNQHVSNGESFDWRGEDLNAIMRNNWTRDASLNPPYTRLYSVRRMRKLELMPTNLATGQLRDMVGWGQSFLITRVQLAEVARKWGHNARAHGPGGGRVRAMYHMLNKGSPLSKGNEEYVTAPGPIGGADDAGGGTGGGVAMEAAGG